MKSISMRTNFSDKKPSGFTLVELLVVIAIIGVLVGLLLPAIQAARERARQAQCTNRQKQISLAMQSYATTGSKGAYPGWAQMQKLGPASANAVGNNEIPIPWSAKLLSQLDRQGLWDQVVDSNVILSMNNAAIYNNLPKIEEYVCPSQSLTNDKLAALTYVMNSGMHDPAPNSGDMRGTFASDLKPNGVGHDQRTHRRGPEVRPGADMEDGASQTFLLTENIHKDNDVVGSTGMPSTWLGPVVENFQGSAPFEMTLNPEQRYGFVWEYNSNSPLTVFADGYMAPINRESSPAPASYGAAGFIYARPASDHPGIFIAAFCDGGVKTLDESISYQVYQQLMTPVGAKARETEDTTTGSPPNYLQGFMSPPLSDSDF